MLKDSYGACGKCFKWRLTLEILMQVEQAREIRGRPERRDDRSRSPSLGRRDWKRKDFKK